MTTKLHKASIKGYSLKSLGCAADGVTDDTANFVAAINTAATNGWSIVNDRDDTFYLASTATITNLPVDIRGGTFLCSGTNGIHITNEDPLVCKFKDVTFKGDELETGANLIIEYDYDSVYFNRDYHSIVSLEDVNVGDPENDVGDYLTAIKLINVTRPNLTRLSLHGYRDVSEDGAGNKIYDGTETFRYRAGSIGLHLYTPDNASPVQMDIFNPDMLAYETVIKAEGAMEGLYLFGGNLINSGQALDLDWSGLTPPVNPGLGIYGTHINCGRGWVKTNYIYDVNITGCHWYRFPGYDNVDFVGFDVYALDRARIQSNVFDGTSNTSAYTNGNVKLGYLDNTKRNDFSGNTYRFFDELWELNGSGSFDNRFLPCLNEVDGVPLVTYSGTASKASQYGELDLYNT